MKEDFIVIYEDEKQVISIPQWFMNFLESRKVKSIRITQKEISTLLPLVYAQLSASGVNIKVPNKTYSSIAPIITYGYGLSLKEPFDKFSNAVEMIASSSDLKRDKKVIEEYFSFYSSFSLPEDENIYCKLFEKEIKGLRGWFAYVSKTDLIVLFWGYENEVEDDEDDLFLIV